MGFRVNSTTSTAVEINKGNVKTITDNGTGDTTLTWKNPFSRAPIIVGSSDTDAGAGSMFNVEAASITTGQFKTRNNAGAVADGTQHVLVCGWDSSTTDIVTPSHTLNSPVIAPRLITFKVKGTGTAAIQGGARHATLTDNGTGDYTLTFTNPFGEAPVIVGTVIGSTAGKVDVVTTAVNAVNVKTYDTAGAATDFDFYLYALGRDSNTISQVPGRAVQTPQRLARFLPFELTVSGGTPTVNIGGKDFSVTDNGVGDFSLAITKPFKRAPHVVMSVNSSRLATAHTVSTSLVRINAFTEAGAAVDASLIHGFVLGFDTADEY